MVLKSTSTLLVFVMLFCNVNKLVFYAGYALNKNYLSSVLCENKAKPKLQCQGKCFLKKELKKAEKSEQKQGSSTKNQIESFINQNFQFRCFTFKTDEYLVPAVVGHFFILIFNIFQPPRF